MMKIKLMELDVDGKMTELQESQASNDKKAIIAEARIRELMMLNEEATVRIEKLKQRLKETEYRLKVVTEEKEEQTKRLERVTKEYKSYKFNIENP